MQARSTEASAFLKSLAHPSRLLVLCALVEREHTAGELEGLTRLAQSALSQHLGKLRESGLVQTRREAQRIYYSLADASVKTVLETLHGIFCGPASAG